MLFNNFTFNHKKNVKITLLAQLASNATSLLILIFGVFLLDTNKYVEIQITMSYLTFCGFTHLGIIDGIELRIAGSEIKRNNYGLISMIILFLSFIPSVIYFLLYFKELNFNVILAFFTFPIINLNSLLLVIFRSRGLSWIGAYGLFFEKMMVIFYLAFTIKYSENSIIYFIFIPILTLAFYYYNIKKLGILFDCEFDLKQTIIDLKRGFSIMFSNTIYNVLSFGSLILASKYYDKEDVSKLAISITFINLFIGLSTQIASVFFPLIANNRELSNEKKFVRQYRSVIQKFIPIFLFFFIFLIFVIQDNFKFLFKKQDLLSLAFAFIPIAFFEIKNQVLNIVLIKLRIELTSYLVINLISVSVGIFLFLIINYFLTIYFGEYIMIIIFSFLIRYVLLSFLCRTYTYFDFLYMFFYVLYLIIIIKW